MKNFRVLLPVLLAAAAFTSCENYRCIKGNDNYTSYTITDVGNFNGLVAEGSFDVRVFNDTVERVTINADDNLISYITTEVINGQLVIATQSGRCLRSKNDILISVYTKGLKDATLTGSGNLVLDDLTGNESEVVLEGSGDIYVKHISSNKANIILDGSGNILCDGFTGGFLNTELFGSGDIRLFDILSDTVYALLEGSGNIELYSWTDASNKFSTSHLNDFILKGSGDIIADKLPGDEVFAVVDGSGNIFTWFVGRLNAGVAGSGYIYYVGHPMSIYFIPAYGNTSFESVVPL